MKIRHLVFSLIPLLFLLVVSEFSLRAYYYLKLGGYRYRIDRLVDLKSAGPYYSESSTISNDLGFSGRGRFDPKKLKDEYRILVLGGSGAAGTADCNWPDVMAEELNKKSLSKIVRVINGGIGGHTSSEEKAWLVRWIKMAPDLIIIYDGWNDMYFSHYLPEEYKEQFDISNRYYYPGFGEKIEKILAEHSIIIRKIKILSKKIKTALENKRKNKNISAKDNDKLSPVPVSLNQAVSDKNTGLSKEFDYEPNKPFKVKLNWRRGLQVRVIDLKQPIQDNMSYIYKTNIQEMIRLAGRYKVSVMLVAQPDLAYHFTEHPELFKGEEGDMVSLIGHYGLRQDWINTVRLLYPRTLEIKKEAVSTNKNVIGVFCIDSIFDNFPKKLYFWNKDSCHQTCEGRDIIGRHMAGLVYDNIIKCVKNF